MPVSILTHRIISSDFRRHLLAGSLLLAVFLLFAPGFASALDKQKFPLPTGAVNDFACVIPADSKARMENLSIEILEKTGTSVVVATFTTLNGENPEMYATDLYAAWGIGKKGEDKGVLILIAVQERKIRIETGYGVEGILPDGLVGSFRDQYLVPYLKKGDYEQGIFETMLAIGAVIAKDAGVTIGKGDQPKKPQQARSRQQRGSGLGALIFLVLIIIFAMTPVGRAMLPWLLLSALSGGRGSGGGGFGGFGGGGFGGFGGGMSGGGGASGDY